MTDSERRLIGYVCEKGNHPSFDGYVDHGACGSHYYADIYVTVERKTHEDGTPYYGRGQQPNLEGVAKAIRHAFEVTDRQGWDE